MIFIFVKSRYRSHKKRGSGASTKYISEKNFSSPVKKGEIWKKLLQDPICK
jgi:hypothetical protein